MQDIVGPEMVFCSEHTLLMYPSKEYPQTPAKHTSDVEDSDDNDSTESEDGEESESRDDLSDAEEVLPRSGFQ